MKKSKKVKRRRRNNSVSFYFRKGEKVMLRDFNNLCGSCVTVFLYTAVGAIGYKAGLLAWDKIETKITK